MICGFKQNFKNGAPTYFAEKIWSNRLNNIIDLKDFIFADKKRKKWFNKSFNYIRIFVPKLHTIREDLNNRYKVGQKLQLAYNVRTKDYLQFHPDIEIKSIQEIKIIYHKELAWPMVIIDKKNLTFCEIEKLAINDGFDDVSNFFEWFNKDFKGKIIHFTDFKY